MASITRRETTLIVCVFLITTAGILMALFVSLVLITSRDNQRKWVKLHQSSLYEMAAECNCSTTKLSYRFPYRQYRSMGRATKKLKFRHRNEQLRNARLSNVLRPLVLTSQQKRKVNQEAFEVQDECFLPPYISEAAENVTSPHTGLFSGIVSISVPRFLDDTDDRLYKCAGALLSPLMVITATECISTTPSNLLNVRSGSRYWTTGGTVHQVTMVRRHGRLAILELSPQAEQSVRPITLNINYEDSWKEAVSAGWGNRCRKHAAFQVEDWTSDACEDCKVAHIEKNATDCHGDAFVGDPLLSMESSLLGIRYCGDHFIDVRVKGLPVWPMLLASTK